MSTYKRADNLSWRRVEDEVLIIDSRINQEVHRLNGVASFIWEKCSGLGKEALLNELLSEYDVSQEKAESDLDSFLLDLIDKKIVEKVSI